MSQYKTTNGRPATFKFGSVNIRVGKKPVAIDSKYVKRILTQYPGWIERVGEVEKDSLELAQTTIQPEAAAESPAAQDPIETLHNQNQDFDTDTETGNSQPSEEPAILTADADATGDEAVQMQEVESQAIEAEAPTEAEPAAAAPDPVKKPAKSSKKKATPAA
jgi:hypothetical protein